MFLGIAALMFGCATSDQNHIAHSKSSAVVVVHVTHNLGATAIPAVAVNARNGKTENGVPIPSQILWTADDSSVTLGIEWEDPKQQCVRALHCSGSDCYGITNTKSKGDQCAYKILVNDVAGTDPVIIVQNCCP
jgi:hypothetical protein